MKRTLAIILAALIALTSAYAAEQKTKKQKVELKEVTYNVPLHCKNCVEKVVDNLSRVKGVKDLDVCLDHQTVAIKYDPAKTTKDVLKNSLHKLGYKDVTEKEHGADDDHHGHSHGHDHDHGHDHNHKH